MAPVSTQQLLANFKGRIKTLEDKMNIVLFLLSDNASGHVSTNVEIVQSSISHLMEELRNANCRTYTGNIVVDVNPIQRLPHLHDIHMMQKYKGVAIAELSRHPFAIADAACRYMLSAAAITNAYKYMPTGIYHHSHVV